jgi:hypothetical protein
VITKSQLKTVITTAVATPLLMPEERSEAPSMGASIAPLHDLRESRAARGGGWLDLGIRGGYGGEEEMKVYLDGEPISTVALSSMLALNAFNNICITEAMTAPEFLRMIRFGSLTVTNDQWEDRHAQ